MNKVYFSEEQHFDLLWMKLLMIFSSAAAIVPLAWACYEQLVLGEPWGQQAPSDFTLMYVTLAMFIIVVGINLMVFSSKLETKISAEGIHYRYFPFIRKWKTVPYLDLTSFEIRKYHAWKEYGGRGFRLRTFNRKGRAFSMRGNQGLQLIFKNGKKLLLGTQRAEEMTVALNRVKYQE